MHILCPHCRNPIEVVKLTHDEIACPSCGSSFHLDAGSTTGWEKTAGQRLGRFELLDVVGHGAFGTVYKARDPGLDRVVAVKVPRAGNLAGPQELDRFLREARSVAQLRHPSVVSVHEVGQADGVPYLVSDFVQGVTLADITSARRLGFREAAELVAAVADALQYAHERGVVHRDVKPSNVMVGDDGRPFVMDFGLAKREAGEVTMTVDGQVLGTPAYMPPEQARGEAHAVDARGDVYSLGVVLYQLLTGELPFRGTQRMLLHQVLHDEPKAPRSLNDRIPRDLETVCLKAMAKEPARRYPSARDFADDLRRWLHGDAVRARPVGRLERAARWARRRPAAAALLGTSAVAVLALVALGVGILYHARLNSAYESEALARSQAEAARNAEAEQRRRAEVAQQGEEAQRKKVEKALETVEQAHRGEAVQRGKAEAALRLADQVAYAHSIFLADLALKANKVPLALERLNECKPELRGWEWRYLRAQCQPELFTIPGMTGGFSPDGSRVIATSTDGVVRVFDATTGQELLAIKGPKPLGPATFSPDGSRILTRSYPLATADRAGPAFDAATGKEVPPPWKPAPSSAAAMAAAVRIVAVADAMTGAGWVNAVATATAPDQVLKPPAPADRRLTVAPDGSSAVYQDRNGTARVFDPRTGRDRATIGTLPAGTQFAFSPDGLRIAAWSFIGEPVIRVFETLTGKQTLTIHATAAVSMTVFSPDGSRIATWSMVSLLLERRIAAAASLPTGDGVVRVFDAVTGRQTLTITGPAPLGFPVFSPDGLRIATVSTDFNGDGTVRVFDAATGNQVQSFGGATRFIAASFSPDGSRLLAMSPVQASVFDAAPGRGTALAGSARLAGIATRAGHADLDGVLRVQRAPGKAELVIKGLARLQRAVLAPDRSRLLVLPDALTGGLALRVFDMATGKEVAALKGPSRFQNAVFSFDGSRVAAGSAMAPMVGDGVVRVFDVATGRQTLALAGPTPFGGAVFSPDGKRIAALPGAAGDSMVRVFNAATGKETIAIRVSHLPPFVAQIPPLAFSEDGSRILALAADGTMTLFDVTTGREVLTIASAAGSATAEFLPDGTLVIANLLGETRLLEAPRDLAVAAAKRRSEYAASLPAWHRQQAAMYEVTQQWFAAAFHFAWIVRAGNATGWDHYHHGLALRQLRKATESRAAFEKALEVRRGLPKMQLADLHAHLGHWQAVRDVLAATAGGPDGSAEDAERLALALLRLNDRAGYARACAAMRQRFGAAPTPQVANTLAWACALAPDALPDLGPAVSWARRAVRSAPTTWPYHGTLGAVLLRAGRSVEAVSELQEAVRLHARGGHPLNHLFLAMAYHRLGKADEARVSLEKATQVLDQAPPADSWTEEAEAQLLRHEAEALIRPGRKSTAE